MSSDDPDSDSPFPFPQISAAPLSLDTKRKHQRWKEREMTEMTEMKEMKEMILTGREIDDRDERENQKWFGFELQSQKSAPISLSPNSPASISDPQLLIYLVVR